MYYWIENISENYSDFSQPFIATRNIKPTISLVSKKNFASSDNKFVKNDARSKSQREKLSWYFTSNLKINKTIIFFIKHNFSKLTLAITSWFPQVVLQRNEKEILRGKQQQSSKENAKQILTVGYTKINMHSYTTWIICHFYLFSV